MSRFLCLLALLVWPCLAAVAQTARPIVRLASATFADDDPVPTAAVREALELSLALRGYTLATDKPHMVWYVAAEATADGSSLAYSVTVTSTPPERIVLEAGRSELFYAGVDAPMPEEGAFVRQMMSEDFMRGMGVVSTVLVRITSTGDLAASVEEAVSVIESRIYHPDGSN